MLVRRVGFGRTIFTARNLQWPLHEALDPA